MQNATEGLPELHGKPEGKSLQDFRFKEFPVLEIRHETGTTFLAEIPIGAITSRATNGQSKCQSICTVLCEFLKTPHARSVTELLLS